MDAILSEAIFSDSDSEDALWAKLNAHCQARYGTTSILYGFAHSYFVSKRLGLTKSLFLKHNHPEDYIAAVGKDDFLNNDICAAAIIEENEPYIWHLAKDDPDLTREQHLQNEIDQQYHMDVGVSFSLRFANGRGIGGLGLCMGKSTPQDFDRIWQLHCAEIALIVKRFDQLMRPLMVRNRLRLSPREREVLALSAGGMVAKEISERLGLQSKSVYNILERARRSMQAASTMEAVAKAHIYELI